jgi:hypothetical protein
MTAGGFEWGYALPGQPTGSNDEYIGYIVRSPWIKILLTYADTA